MQGCPLYFGNIKTSKNPSIIEGFNTQDQCTDEGSDGSKENKDWYESVRAKNLEQADSQYNNLLADYLNNYNRYLVLKGLQENAAPGTDFNEALNQAEDKYKTAKNNIDSYAEDIENNNKHSQDLIEKQTKDIQNKTMAIQMRNKQISEQGKIIDDRNGIMNSRTRQIQMGVEKNLYKRNIMYFLIFINIVVLVILFFIIRDNRKN